MSNKPKSRKEDLAVQELNGEVLIYDLKRNRAFCLNETSALVWQMCDGEKSVDEISRGLSKKLNNPANEDLVWLAIDQLKKEKLLANGEELNSKLEGVNRRDVIKKIGLGTMVALPIIAGLAAPRAAQAQSCTPGGSCTCNAPNNNVICGTGGAGTPCANAACRCQRDAPGATPGTCVV